MQLSRRSFFRTSISALGATAAVSALPFHTEAFAIGEPQRATQPVGPVLLNSNENPYGPWPSLKQKMAAALELGHRYPDAPCERLAEKIAELHRVSADQVIMGCGSSEILRVCAEVFGGPGKTLVQASPTFESLGHYAETRGTKVRAVRLNSKFEHDLENMGPASGEKVGLVYICNPNNPTASITPRKSIEAYVKTLPPDTYVLIDEAYHHFALGSPDYVSFLDQPVNDPRIIVARTFSKIYGLAGIRLGYAVAQGDTAKKMQAHSSYDNVNIVAAKCGIAALDDAAGLAAAIKRTENDRAEFIGQAQKRKIAMVPSQGNFVMIETGKPVRKVIDYFKSQNVMIGRPFPPLDTHARITLGTPTEMQAFWKAWDGMGSS
jgi:histidinol-phosphate aminotransferase